MYYWWNRIFSNDYDEENSNEEKFNEEIKYRNNYSRMRLVFIFDVWNDSSSYAAKKSDFI